MRRSKYGISPDANADPRLSRPLARLEIEEKIKITDESHRSVQSENGWRRTGASVSFARAVATAEGLRPRVGHSVVKSAREAFIQGVQLSTWMAAAVGSDPCTHAAYPNGRTSSRAAAI